MTEFGCAYTQEEQIEFGWAFIHNMEIGVWMGPDPQHKST